LKIIAKNQQNVVGFLPKLGVLLKKIAPKRAFLGKK
jgi:hypothetical protein